MYRGSDKLSNKNEIDLELRAIDKISSVVDGIRKSIKDLDKLSIGIDLKNLDASVKAANSKLSSTLLDKRGKLNVTINQEGLNRSISTATRSIGERLEKEHTVSIKAKAEIPNSLVNKAIRDVQGQLNRDLKIKLGVDSSPLSKGTERAKASIDRLTNGEYKIKLDADTSKAQRKVDK